MDDLLTYTVLSQLSYVTLILYKDVPLPFSSFTEYRSDTSGANIIDIITIIIIIITQQLYTTNSVWLLCY